MDILLEIGKGCCHPAAAAGLMMSSFFVDTRGGVGRVAMAGGVFSVSGIANTAQVIEYMSIVQS